MLPWISRIIVLVLDGAGIGALPDAAAYGDDGSNTLGHVADQVPLHLPHLQQLGLGNVVTMRGLPRVDRPRAALGRMAERSAGKDSTVGHWELMGVVCPTPFPTYADGFPEAIIREFAARAGRPVIGNRPASGTEIIAELYEEHRQTGSYIVYTSADSVFQVAAHEDVIPVAELYRACALAAELLMPAQRVLRVIARPFTGTAGHLRRLPGRRDYNVPPPLPTVLDLVSGAHCPVVTVGKVDALFAGQGITLPVHASGNVETMRGLCDELEFRQPGLTIANLIDFDMLYGHRNDAAGFGAALNAVDAWLPHLLGCLGDRDVLAITADHGCDPTLPGTDHTREHVPLLVYGERIAAGTWLGTRDSFADLGATICEAFGVGAPAAGRSFWPAIVAHKPREVHGDRAHRVDWLRSRDSLGRGAG